MHRVVRLTLAALMFATSAVAAQSTAKVEVDMTSAGHTAPSVEVNNDAIVTVQVSVLKT